MTIFKDTVWTVKKKDNKDKILKVKVEAYFDSEYSAKELKKIQEFYNKRNKKINFEEEVKVDGTCFKYRTKLILSWGEETQRELGFIMFNPSFANPKKSDNTARNAIMFADNQGFDKIIIFNLFPIRLSSADILCQYYENEKISFKNYKCDINIDELPDEVVLCWGKLPKKITNIDDIIGNFYSELKKVNKKLYQITDEDFQRHLASPSINSISGKKTLGLNPLHSIYKFNNKERNS